MKAFTNALLGIALAGAATLAMAAPPRIATADFFKERLAQNLTLSPTGEYLTVEVPKEDRTILVAMKASDLKPIKHWDFGKDFHVARTVWVNDDRISIAVAKQEGTEERPRLQPNLLMTDIDGSKSKYIDMGAAYTIVSTTPDDPQTIIVSRNEPTANLYKMNVYSGAIAKLSGVPLRPGSFLVNKDGDAAFATGSKDDMKFYVYRRENNAWKQIHESAMGEAAIQPVRLAGDGKHAYFSVSDRGEPERLVLRNLETGEDKLLQPSRASDIEGTLSDFNGENVIGVRYQDGVPYYEFMDLKSPEAKVYGGLINSFDDKVVEFRGKSRDGNLILFRAYSDTDPGSFYLYDRKTTKARFLMAAMPWIKPAQMAQMNPITVTARDGTKLHGFLTVPNGSTGRNLPLILNPHGGPHGPRDYWGFNREVQFLANRGYAVLQLNFRGSGGYGNAFEKLGYRNWGTTMIDDMTDAVKKLVSDGVADPKRICTYGASYGGYAALQSVIREPDLYRCAIGYVGVYDLDQLAKDSDIQLNNSGRKYLNRVYPETAEERRAQSPRFNVDKIKVPVMLIHGGSDQRVPMSQFKLFTKALEDAGKAPEDTLVELNEGHGFAKPENQVKAADRTAAFLDRHIGAGK